MRPFACPPASLPAPGCFPSPFPFRNGDLPAVVSPAVRFA
ncbi:hypothetical protein SAMN05216570_1198 [Dyella sp. OK004]|nr:hypothetical protein SAMN05216570_1198 [Dyella sp. OK004]